MTLLSKMVFMIQRNVLKKLKNCWHKMTKKQLEHAGAIFLKAINASESTSKAHGPRRVARRDLNPIMHNLRPALSDDDLQVRLPSFLPSYRSFVPSFLPIVRSFLLCGVGLLVFPSSNFDLHSSLPASSSHESVINFALFRPAFYFSTFFSWLLRTRSSAR